MFGTENKPHQPHNVETIIGPSVKLEGEFEGNGDIIVEGVVLGNLKTKNNLRIGKNAKIKADIEAQNAYIAGEVSGSLKIQGGLELTSTAKVIGDVEVKMIAIEKGAYFNGKINMAAVQVTNPNKPTPKSE